MQMTVPRPREQALEQIMAYILAVSYTHLTLPTT